MVEVDGGVGVVVAMTMTPVEERLDDDRVDNVVPNYQFLQSYDPLPLLPRPHHNHKDKKVNVHQKIHHVLVPFQV